MANRKGTGLLMVWCEVGENAQVREAMIHPPESPGVWRKTFELGA